MPRRALILVVLSPATDTRVVLLMSRAVARTLRARLPAASLGAHLRCGPHVRTSPHGAAMGRDRAFRVWYAWLWPYSGESLRTSACPDGLHSFSVVSLRSASCLSFSDDALRTPAYREGLFSVSGASLR